jgi:tetratricopeptide (TPR) repeat protein
MRANSYKILKQFSKAIEDYSEAIKLENGNKTALLNRAICYEMLDKTNESLKDYNILTKIDSENSLVWHNRGTIFMENNDFENAINDLTKSINLKGNNISDRYYIFNIKAYI